MDPILNRLRTADNATSCDGGHPFGTAAPKRGRHKSPFRAKQHVRKGSEKQPRLSIGNADALPSKEAGIDRPHSWPQERQCGTEDAHEDARPWIREM